MLCPHYTEPVEKYSSYKKRFFNKYQVRAKALLTGINDLSLKNEDKQKLKKMLIQIFKDEI